MIKTLYFTPIIFVFSYCIGLFIRPVYCQCRTWNFDTAADYITYHSTISGGAASLEKSRQIGEVWEDASLPGSPATGSYDLEQFSDGNLYIAARDSSNGRVIWRSTDGTSWNSFILEIPGVRRAQKASRLAEGADGTIYAATQDTTIFWPEPGLSGVWRSTDGVNWGVVTGLPGGGCTSVVEAPDGALIATTKDDGRVWRCPDPGSHPEQWVEVWNTTAALVGGALPQPNYPSYPPPYQPACPYLFDYYGGEHCNGQPYDYYPSTYRPDRTQALFKSSDGRLFFSTNSGGEDNAFSGYQALRGFGHIYTSTDGINWLDGGSFNPPQTDSPEYIYSGVSFSDHTHFNGTNAHDIVPPDLTYPTWIDNFSEDRDGNVYACSTNNDPLRSWILNPRRDAVIYKLDAPGAGPWNPQSDIWNALGNLYSLEMAGYGTDTYTSRNATFVHDMKGNPADGSLWAGTSTLGMVHRSTDGGVTWDWFTSPRHVVHGLPEEGNMTSLEITCTSCLYAGYEANGEIYVSRSQYYSDGYLENTTGYYYSTALAGFSESTGSDGFGTTTYQISGDSAAFFYWDMGAWSSATVPAESNPAEIINDNISSFPAPGTFYFRVYLHPGSDKACPKTPSLNTVAVCLPPVQTPTPTLTPTPTATPTAAPTPPLPSTATPTPTMTPSVTPTPLHPAIELIKTADGFPDGTVAILPICEDPAYYYAVTNTGDTYLSAIEVWDDNGTPKDPGDDILIGTIPGPLAPTQSAQLEYTFPRLAMRLNTATATGNPTDSSGHDLPGLPDAGDEDDALAFTWLVIGGNDYNGDGRSDIDTWKCGAGKWYIQLCPYNQSRSIYFGQGGDLPAPGDYDGDGTTEVAVFRPATGLWAIRGMSRFYFGSDGDIPVPADYDGDGSSDSGLFRRPIGLWAIRAVTRVYFGGLLDLPIPGVYDGSGRARIAVYRPAASLWMIRGLTRRYYGRFGDYPVPADYDGDGLREFGIFREGPGLWAIDGFPRVYFGERYDYPQPADYDGDGTDRIAVYRPSNGLWAIRGLTRKYWGGPNAIPITW